MARTKEIKKKIAKKPTKPAAVEAHDEEEAESVPAKGKIGKPIDLIDAHDPLLPEVEEKADDEAALAATEEEEDAPSLDTEDLNPFGDKWEE